MKDIITDGNDTCAKKLAVTVGAKDRPWVWSGERRDNAGGGVKGVNVRALGD